MKIAVAGTGYVGLSISILLAKQHQVTAVDIIPERVELINKRNSPIEDEYIEKFLNNEIINLTATTDEKSAYVDAEFVIIILSLFYSISFLYGIEVITPLFVTLLPDAFTAV